MPGPLDGVTVLDLSQVVSGPLAAAWLGDQGADVIKIEAPGLGDLCRWVGPRKEDLSAMFITCNRGKKSVVLDLKNSEADRATLHALIAEADVLVENFRPGAMKRLGLDPKALLEKHPRLILCSITGFGAEGPYSSGRVYDPLIQATTGHADAQFDPKTGDPRLVQTIVCDKTTALTSAQAITAALFARERTGQGQHVEVSMIDTGVAFLWADGMYNHTFADYDGPPFPDLGSFYSLWRTSDGWVSIIGVQDAEYAATCRAIDRPDLVDDERFSTLQARAVNWSALVETMTPDFAKFSTADLLERMAKEDAPAAPVNRRGDLVNDPQLKVNETIQEIDHGELGAVRLPRHPARFSATPAHGPRPAPRLGADSAAVKAKLDG